MDELHEDLVYALVNEGPVQRIRTPSQEEVARLYEILPNSLAHFIELEGYCSFHGGLFSMCNPDDLRPILALVFGADEQFHHKDCQVVGYTAFGDLICWSDSFWKFDTDLPSGQVYSTALTRNDWAPKRSADDYAAGIIPDRIGADYVDFRGEPMFDRCVAMYGPLEPGECYGFFPALAMVGVASPLRRVENIRRVKALEHFAILAQMDTFYLMKTVPNGVAPVRPIG